MIIVNIDICTYKSHPARPQSVLDTWPLQFFSITCKWSCLNNIKSFWTFFTLLWMDTFLHNPGTLTWSGSTVWRLHMVTNWCCLRTGWPRGCNIEARHDSEDSNITLIIVTIKPISTRLLLCYCLWCHAHDDWQFVVIHADSGNILNSPSILLLFSRENWSIATKHSYLIFLLTSE